MKHLSLRLILFKCASCLFYVCFLFCVSPNSGPKGQITSTILSSCPWPRTLKRDPQLRNYCRWSIEATHLRFCKRNRRAILCLFVCLPVFQHPFVSQPLSRTLAIELLDKANNPDHSTFNDFDDDDPEPEVNFDLLKITLPNVEVIVFLLDFIFFPWNHTLLSFH